MEWILLAIFSALLGLHTLPRAWRTLNTDFPNYYLTAQLGRTRYDTAQAYDWRWLQREKDDRASVLHSKRFAIDQLVVGLAPITPFSTLFLWPLTRLPPLTAKHLWLLFQLAFLLPVALILKNLSRQPLRRVALLMVLCFPLQRNLLYGQFYLLLLAMLVIACWAYLRRLSGVAGTLIAIATMTKIFPAIFLLYFLRKRDFRALTAAAITLLLCIVLSIKAFGWPMHRYYLQAVLPSTLRGEALPPYFLSSSSISTLLHRLFLYEPQWNPHPWHNAPRLFAILLPTLQMLILAPAILLIHSPSEAINTRDTAPLEWSALLCATLAISTCPASYNFTLLIFPAIVLCGFLLPRSPSLAVIAVLLYLAVGYPSWNTANVDGLRAILHEPRLFFLILFTALCCWALRQASTPARFVPDLPWSIALTCLLAVSIAAGVRHQRGLQADYADRLPSSPDVLLFADPAYTVASIQTIGLLPNGYRLIETASAPAQSAAAPPDQLTFAPSTRGDWIEQSAGASQIVSSSDPSSHSILQARNPIPIPGEQPIAYIRDQLGRGQLMQQPATPLTGEDYNVLDASVAPDASFYFAATIADAQSALFHLDRDHVPRPMNLGQARYPAVSPDGRWLAFSRFQSGAWNLYLLELQNRRERRLTNASCNQVEPSWEPDSRTLLYASDCGRALGFTAICRRRVLP